MVTKSYNGWIRKIRIYKANTNLKRVLYIMDTKTYNNFER